MLGANLLPERFFCAFFLQSIFEKLFLALLFGNISFSMESTLWNIGSFLSQNDAFLFTHCRIFAQAAQIMHDCIFSKSGKTAIFHCKIPFLLIIFPFSLYFSCWHVFC